MNEATNEALKLASQARSLLEQTNWTNWKDNLPEISNLLDQTIDRLVSQAT